MKKPLWVKKSYGDGPDEFEVRTCHAVVAYLKAKTGIKSQVHKTERYLVVNWSTSVGLQTAQVPIPGGVLYCLEEKDFQPILDAMNGLTSNRRTINDPFEPSHFETKQTVTLRLNGNSPKMKELIEFLIEEANRFPHPNYEDFSNEIELLKHAEIEIK